MHGATRTPNLSDDPAAEDPRARRIAALSSEYLEADAARRDAIAREIAGLIEGRVTPFGRG